jgi:hypothetical protein
MLSYLARIVKRAKTRTIQACDSGQCCRLNKADDVVSSTFLASLTRLCYICTSHAIGVTQKGVFMTRIVSSVVLVGIMGCTSVQYNEVDCGTLPSDTFWSGNIALQCQEYRRLQAETAYRAEVAQSLKSYRECVSKHAGSLAGAKEQCSVYIQGLRDSPGGPSSK